MASYGLATMLLLGGFVLAVAGSASAHTCEANTHTGCNGHDCPPVGVHSHTTDHWGPNHECQSHDYAVYQAAMSAVQRLT